MLVVFQINSIVCSNMFIPTKYVCSFQKNSMGRVQCTAANERDGLTVYKDKVMRGKTQSAKDVRKEPRAPQDLTSFEKAT